MRHFTPFDPLFHWLLVSPLAAAMSLRTADAVIERPVASTIFPSGPYFSPGGNAARSEGEAI